MADYRRPVQTISPIYFKEEQHGGINLYRLWITDEENIFYSPDIDNPISVKKETYQDDSVFYKSDDGNYVFSANEIESFSGKNTFDSLNPKASNENMLGIMGLDETGIPSSTFLTTIGPNEEIRGLKRYYENQFNELDKIAQNSENLIDDEKYLRYTQSLLDQYKETYRWIRDETAFRHLKGLFNSS